jgi:hypothetical protein
MPVTYTSEAGIPVQASASKLCKTGKGVLIGIFCSSVLSSSRIALCDAVASVASAGAGRFIAPFLPVAGYTKVGAFFTTGLYVSLTGSAQQCTLIVGQGT